MIYPYSSDIYTICSSAKLLHYCFRPYIVEKQVGFILYYLKASLYTLKTIFGVLCDQAYSSF